MSRAYRVNVEAKGITESQLADVMVVELGWEEMDSSTWKEVTYFEGEGNLCGGCTEEEAHNRIKAELLKLNLEAKVLTRWTNLDEIPSNPYGSLD